MELTLVNIGRALSVDSGAWYHAHMKSKSVFTSMQSSLSNLQAFTSSRKILFANPDFYLCQFVSVLLQLIKTLVWFLLK